MTRQPRARLQRWSFFEPVYMAQLSIYRGSYTAFGAEMTRRFGISEPDTPAPGGLALEYTNAARGTRQYVLWVPAGFDVATADRISTLAHECLHLTMFVLTTRGCEATDATQEPYCYLHGWLVKECWQRLRTRRKRGTR